LGARHLKKGKAAAEELRKDGIDAHAIAIDVSDSESIKKAAAQVENDFGRLDVLVNNAGVEKTGSVEELPLADFRSVMETNYFGAIRCIQALAPSMRQRRSGCIINVTSVAGRIASAPMAPYTASKWALEALSEALAGEMKTFGVRVAIVEPGIIDTAMARRIGVPASPSPYRQRERFAALFTAALKNPAHPSLVAKKIVEIAESDTWQLRHAGRRRRPLPAVACRNDRRGLGGFERKRRRDLVPRDRTRLRFRSAA